MAKLFCLEILKYSITHGKTIIWKKNQNIALRAVKSLDGKYFSK
jgi:hypothetical protein